ncbi:hypothetical protein BC629DRAFT_1505099 [Irpex lacteus]|nr:hypothetical protein BC629DRAFT_1505099 [Irpex lacteus]
MKSMPPAPQLPIELLDGIVLSLPTVASRKACTLVSRSWAAAAYPRVFRCIKLSENMLTQDAPTRGRYCVKRLLNRLLTCSHFLPFCVRELFLDTFDSDGFTFGQFKQVLDRFPGIDVIGYNVRHFVLLPPSPNDGEEELQPPSLPISPGRRFKKVHISIGEYGTASAFAQYIGLFDPDCIDELSIGHLEVEEDRFPAVITDPSRPARPRTIIKESSGRVTKENVRVLHTVLDSESVESIIDETDGGKFIIALNLLWNLENVQRISTWFSEDSPEETVMNGIFHLAKFPGLRTFDITIEIRRYFQEGIASSEPFDAFAAALKTAPLTLSDVEAKVVVVNIPKRRRPIASPYFYGTLSPTSTSTFYNSGDIAREAAMLDWDAFTSAMQKLMKAGCRPSVRVDIIAQDEHVKPEQYCRVPREPLPPHPLANTQHVHSLLREIVMPHLVHDSQVRERVTFNAILHPNAQ